MLFNKIDDNGLALELYVFDHHPQIEVDGNLIDDPNYISEPIPNGIFVSEEFPAKWTGKEWVATGVSPELPLSEPTIEERLEETERIAQMTSLAFSEYVFGAMKGDY